MLTYVGRRLLYAIPVLFGILLLSFIFVKIMPGDPIRAMMDPQVAANAPPEFVARRRAELGLDSSISVQFLAWMREVFQGNLGFSFRRPVPVTQMISEKLGPTVLLASIALLLALVVGVAIGVLSALKQNTAFDYVSSVVSMAAISIPNFFLGLMAIYVFAIWLDWLPTGGMRDLAGDPSIVDTVKHLVLPVAVLAANLAGPYVRYTRQSMLEVIHQDYMITARAKGVGRKRLVMWHALRNALIPLTTVIALQIPVLLTGVLVIEVVFAWPGLGRLAYDAILVRDHPVIMGMVFLSGLLVLFSNLVSDVVAAVLDPRIRL